MKNQIKKLEKQIKNDKPKKEFNIFDIAKYLLDNCPQKYGSGITQIQKLLYYAQAEYLICYREPLFNEEIQAWYFGPVVVKVYIEFVRCFAEKIDFFKKNCSKNPLPNEVIQILKIVLKKHGFKEPHILIGQTHNEDPWKTIYHPDKEWSDSVITIEKIYNFFKNQK